MDQNNQRREDYEYELEPIRESVVILVAKLATALILFELLYGAVFYALNLEFTLPFDLHHHISVAIFILGIVKLVFQVILIISVTLSWTNTAYYIARAGKHIIRRRGIIHIDEDVLHFANMRSVSFSQSFLGRIFNFGDVTIKMNMIESDEGDIFMMGISNPKKYERMLRDLF